MLDPFLLIRVIPFLVHPVRSQLSEPLVHLSYIIVTLKECVSVLVEANKLLLPHADTFSLKQLRQSDVEECSKDDEQVLSLDGIFMQSSFSILMTGEFRKEHIP